MNSYIRNAKPFIHKDSKIHNNIKIASTLIENGASLLQVLKVHKNKQKDSFYIASYEGAREYLAHLYYTSFKVEMYLQDCLWEENNNYLFEVKTEFGRIDCVTNHEIIEIKKISSWKEGLGQLLVYTLDYPDYSRKLYLYGKTKEPKKLNRITSICNKYNINVTYRCIS